MGILLIIACIATYFLASHELTFYHTLKAKGKPAEATVVEISEHKTVRRTASNSREVSYSYAPIVRYRVARKTYHLESSTGSSRKEDLPKKGDKMTVLYNPEQPSEAIFGGAYGESSVWTIKMVARFALGAAVLLTFILFLIDYANSNKNKSNKFN